MELTPPRSEASYSLDRRYRYLLRRTWDPCLPYLGAVLLNPPSAQHEAEDATLVRLERRARGQHYGGLLVANLYGLVARSPRALTAVRDPVGPANDASILAVAAEAAALLLAWGNQHRYGRAQRVLNLLAPYHAKLIVLGRTKLGHPRHPLRVAYATPLKPYPGGVYDP